MLQLKTDSRESPKLYYFTGKHYVVVRTKIGKERKRITMEVYYHYTKSESRGDSSKLQRLLFRLL